MSITLLKPLPTPKNGKTIAHMWPMWGDGAPVLFWANNGLVRCEDRRDSTPRHKRTKTLSVETLREHLEMFSLMIIMPNDDPRWSFERRRAFKFLSEADEVAKEAEAQGSPTAVVHRSPVNQSQRMQLGFDKLQATQLGFNTPRSDRLRGKVFLPTAGVDF